MRTIVTIFLLLSACSSSQTVKDASSPATVSNPDSETAMTEMCVEENLGMFRFSRAYIEEFCRKIKAQGELICLRFTHATKDWHKACPGIDTADKLECVSTITNGSGYALLASLEKCREVNNRRQVYCLSKLVSKAGVPLQPEQVKECLEKNL